MMTLGWTPCSTSTLTASITVFPVPESQEGDRGFRGIALVNELVLSCLRIPVVVGVTEW